jgi:ribonuclease HI
LFKSRYKVNWDVAINSTMRTMGVGIIVRDNRGQVHAASSKTIVSTQEPVVAEAMGALCAAEFIRDLGFQDVDLEGDSLQVVQAIREAGTN